MKHALHTLIAIAVLSATTPAAAAVELFSTGTGGNPNSGGQTLDYSLYEGQWLAGRLNWNTTQAIGGIQAWLYNNSVANGTLHVALHSDINGAIGREIAAWKTTVAFDNTPDWEGISGINYTLARGNYWIAFEVREGDTFVGAVPDSAGTALSGYAFTEGGQWASYAPINSAVRVLAPAGSNVGGVPEAATWAMLIAGFGMVGANLRQKRRIAA